MHRPLQLIIVLVGLLAALLAGQEAAVAATPATASGGERQSYAGTIGGAPFRVEVPQRRNGTLVLYSHGYLPPGFPSFGIALTNRPPDRSETEAWLLEHGYAMAPRTRSAAPRRSRRPSSGR